MPQPGDPDYETLLARIYDAPLQPDGWPDLMALLTPALGGIGGTLLFQDRSGGLPDTQIVAITGYPDEAEALYNMHFAAQDDRLGQVLAGIPGQAMADQWQLDHTAYLKTPIFNEFYRRFGLECGMGVRLFGGGPRIGVLSAFKGVGRDTYSPAEMRLLEQLAPHVTRSLQLKRQLDQAEARADGLLSGLDRFPQSVVLLDPGGRVTDMNAAADTLLSHPDSPLTVRERRLFTAGPADAACLRRILVLASAGKARPDGPPPPVLRLRSRDGLLAVGVMAVPVTRGDALGLSMASGVLVFIAAPALHDPVQPTVLAQHFGLSASEAQVAAGLALGDSVSDIAERRQVSRETVRAQVKQVLAKTGMNSQSRLVALVTRSLAGLRRV